MTETVLLVNPAAGAGRAMGHALAAAEVLRDGGHQVQLMIGRSATHSADVVAQAVSQQAPRLLVCGGDGLVHLAIQSVALAQTALGVIPAGTGNDIARALGLPLRDPVAAAAIVHNGHERMIDLGRVRDRWFASVLAVGLDSRVNDRANRLGWPHGNLRFHAALALELPTFKPVSVHLVMDGRVENLQAMLVAVGNGPSYGGGMRICPGADVSDGLFDITVVTDISHAKLVRLFPSVYSGRHVLRPEVLTFRASSVDITADDITGYADGELIGQLPLSSKVVRAALRVIC